MSTPTSKRHWNEYPRRVYMVHPVADDAWDDDEAEGRARDRRLVPCAACGATDHVRPDPRCGGIAFCEDCSDRSRLLTPWDDLGGP